jgi:type II secretory pathway component HofQ
MDTITSLEKFRNPYGNQEIELQQVVYEAGGTPMLRLRIKERGARFTIFDIDPLTARHWAQTMLAWAEPLADGVPAPLEDH